MPRGDRTGPAGEGPMTGRQLGYGSGYDSPGYTKGSVMGSGRGLFGRGRSFWNRNVNPGSGRHYFWNRMRNEETEKRFDKNELEVLRTEINALKNTISSILEKFNPKRSEEDGKVS